MTVHTFRDGRVRKLKEGVTLTQYQEKYPQAIVIDPPTMDQLQEAMFDGTCEAIDGCIVEPDGRCEHGYDSWLLHLGLI